MIEVDGWEDRDDITVVVREPKKNEHQKTWKGKPPSPSFVKIFGAKLVEALRMYHKIASAT